MAEKLIIFSRFPVPGQAKTRLIPALGAGGAARLQREFTEWTVALGREVAKRRNLDLELRFTGGTARQFRGWLGKGLAYCGQGRGDLGARLARALSNARKQGYRRVVLIGADCPTLSTTIVDAAFTALVDHDLVVGPALDGGYYLLGLARGGDGLFLDQPWGTPRLLSSTLASASRLGLKFHLLPELADVDCPEDLVHLDRHPDPERG